MSNIERTLGLLKPDLVNRNLIGAALAEIEKSGFIIKQIKSMYFTEDFCKDFYAEHTSKPFFKDIVHFMGNGMVIALVLESEDAIKRYRQLIGATNPLAADEGTLRKLFGISIDENSFHGSADPESAEREISIIFKS